MSYLFPSSTITIDAALRDLAQGSPKARTAAAHALGDVEDPAEKRRAVDALVRALDDDRPEVRAEACASLGDLGDVAPLAMLIRRLDDGSPAVRQNAAIALGTLAHPDGFEPLAQALREGPADLRFQAATSLAEIDQARAFDPLAAALGDGDPQVVAAAALSLGAIGDPRAAALLAARLDHKEAATRFDVAYALAELGDPAGRGVLSQALRDIDRAWDAVTALGRLATTDDAEVLGRALTGKHTPPEATVLAAGTLIRIAPNSAHHDAARRVLLAGLGARKTHIRGIAVEQLGEVGGAWALAPLDKLARSGKGAELRDAIATAQQMIAARGDQPAGAAKPTAGDIPAGDIPVGDIPVGDIPASDQPPTTAGTHPAAKDAEHT
ncbi:MAG TPA: HEAT repeat domain-containing protein [Kofleriaceae bacterium]|nr:HEAT repeat domain-containing protein [Kofleriaceae bacterium]